MAKRSPPAVTIKAGMIANVRGIRILRLVPSPGLLCTSIVPPIFSIFVLTTSMPTPRPEMFEIRSAVLNPGRKNQNHRQSRWYEEGPLKGPLVEVPLT